MSLYYQPSKSASAPGAWRTLAAGLLTAAVLGPAYGFGVVYFAPSIVYLNTFWCFFVAALLGIVLGHYGKCNKLRYPALTLLMGLGVGLVTGYLAWGTYLATRPVAAGQPVFDVRRAVSFLLHPGQMGSALQDLNRSGTWAVAGNNGFPQLLTRYLQATDPAGAWPLRDVMPLHAFIWSMWGLELLCLGLVPGSIARLVAQEPFSEVSQEWCVDYRAPFRATYLPDRALARAALETGQFSILEPFVDTTVPGAGWLPNYATLTLHSFPHDSTAHYLSVHNTVIARASNSSNTTTAVVKYLIIPSAVYHELRVRFGGVPTDYNGPVGPGETA